MRRRGEQRIEETLDVEMLLKYSKLVRVMSKMMFKSKFEQVLAASQRQQFVLTEQSDDSEGYCDPVDEDAKSWMRLQIWEKEREGNLTEIESQLVRGVFKKKKMAEKANKRKKRRRRTNSTNVDLE